MSGPKGKGQENVSRNIEYSEFSSEVGDFHFCLRFSTQALTTLDLSNNGFQEEGGKYLADALKTNNVNFSLSYFSFIFIFVLNTDTSKTYNYH